jgi:aryl-alcohol dehydrogenase-like predicted oxidoreductase
MTKCRNATSVEGEAPLNMWQASVNDGRMVNRAGLSRKHIFDAVEKSMKRLGTYIDVLQIHRMDRDVPHEEIMRALNDVIENGWVRYIGACSVSTILHRSLSSLSHNRCLRGSFKCSRMLQRSMAGTNLSACKIITICCTERKNAK